MMIAKYVSDLFLNEISSTILKLLETFFFIQYYILFIAENTNYFM